MAACGVTGRQARQPVRVQPLRQRRRARGARRRRSRLPPAVVERSLNEAGVAFLFAPSFHPSMKHAAPTRRGARPAHRVQPAGAADQSGRAARQIVGVPRPELTELRRARAADAGIRARVGRPRRRRARRDLDDRLHEGLRGVCRHGAHVPRPSGRLRHAARRRSPPSLVAMPRENAAIMRRLLDGEPGPVSDIVRSTLAPALFVAGRAASVERGHCAGAIRARRRAGPGRAATLVE